MPMGITRVADQYGHLAEAEARRANLAAMQEQMAAMAASSHGHGITAGLNDPRRLYATDLDVQAPDDRVNVESPVHVGPTDPDPYRTASDPRDRSGDAWASGRDRGDAEHKRHDLDDDDHYGPDEQLLNERNERLDHEDRYQRNPDHYDPYEGAADAARREWFEQRQQYAAKGDFGGKKAPPFGSKPGDEDEEDLEDRYEDGDEYYSASRQAAYPGSDVDYANHRLREYGPDDIPADERSAESGYDPDGDWQDHRRTPIGPMVVGAYGDAWTYDAEIPPPNEERIQQMRDKGFGGSGREDPHDDWDDGFGGWQTNMDDGTWSSDHEDDFGDDFGPHNNYGEGLESYNHETGQYEPRDSKWGHGGWESGLDRPFTGSLDPDMTADPLMSADVVDPVYGGDPSYHDPVT